MSKLVLVTGASSGIGEATAKRYAEKGARVLLLARSEERLGRVVEAIERAGGAASPYPIDLAKPEAVAETAARIEREHGTPDILINNAGAGRWLPLVETSPAEARAMIEVPYLAAVYVTRAFLPEMLARRSGHVACITSPAAYLAWPNASTYIAARRAVAGFADALRSEVKGKGVDVTLVVLGTVETPYWQHNPGSREHLPKRDPRFLPNLTSEQAAEAIVDGVAQRQARVVKPGIYRAIFLLNALFPGVVAKQMRRAARKG